MKFTKLTVLALILALLVCTFVACGGGAETETETETNAPGTETETETETEPAHVHELEKVITEATCTSRGYEQEVCKTCGENVSTKPIPMTDHVAKDGANCTTNEVCKFCETVMTVAPGHTFGEATVTKEATCEAEGEKTQTCTVCNGKVTEAIAKVPHAIATVTETKASTLTEAGYEKGVCSLCNKEAINETPKGITLDIDALADGILPDGFTASAGFDMFYGTVDKPTTANIADKSKDGVVYEGGPGDWANVLTDPITGNKYITKAEGTPADAGILFEDTTGVMNGAIVEISFDYRCDAATNNGGLVAFNDRELAVTDEMRMLSIWSGEKVVFAANSSMVVAKIDLTNPQWINFRIVANTKTLEYEVYVDGVKKIYTEYDENNKPVVYALQDDGSWKTFTNVNFGNQSPFHSDDGVIKGVYFWHYNRPAGALDNIRFAVLTPAQ